jgi:asparagine synthase (glutamine-hydrolysing)
MCGLAGIVAADGSQPSPSDLQAMSSALAHRGPDAHGTCVSGGGGLAHRRLAILDLSDAGRQPLANEDGSVQVVYNGQLFGFEPLRARLESLGHRFRSRTDTEVLVHLYEERGDALLEDVDGMFAFAIWDAPRARLLLARDRLGIKPLYYVVQDGTLAFASEMGALARAPSWPACVRCRPAAASRSKAAGCGRSATGPFPRTRTSA